MISAFRKVWALLPVVMFASLLVLAGAARAADTVQDPAVVGRWRVVVPTAQGNWVMTWNIGADGHYSYVWAPPATPPPDSGRLIFSNGQWTLTSETGKKADSGTYRVLDAESFEATGSNGTFVWVRMANAAPANAASPPATPAPTPAPASPPPPPATPAPAPAPQVAPPAANTPPPAPAGPPPLAPSASSISPAPSAPAAPAAPPPAVLGSVTQGQFTIDSLATRAPFLGQFPFWISSDGRHLGIAYPRSIAIDGNKFPSQGGGTVSFSDDSQYAYTCDIDYRNPRSVSLADGHLVVPPESVEGKASPDGRHHASAVRQGFRWATMLDGKKSEYKYASVNEPNFSPPYFSPDSQHLAWMVKTWGSDSYMCVLDDKEGPKMPGFYNVAGDTIPAVMFSPDSQHIYYAKLIANNNYVLMEDGAPVAGPGVLGFIQGTWLTFSPGGKHRFYITQSADPKDPWATFVLDGQPGPKYQQITAACFSPDGSHVAYVAQKGASQVVVLDGKEGKEYASIGKWHSGDALGIGSGKVVTFSPDGKHVGYIAGVGPKQIAVLDGQENPPHDNVGAIHYSPDSQHYAYLESDSAHDPNDIFRGSFAAVVDGREQKRYDRIDTQENGFTSDGRFIYVALNVPSTPTGNSAQLPDGTTWMLVADGKEWPKCDGIGYLTFSAAGGHYACVEYDGGTRALISDGVKGPACPRVEIPVYSADGKHLAYLTSKANWTMYPLDKGNATIIIDGQPAPVCDVLLLPFNNGDGNYYHMVPFDATDHLVYLGLRAQTLVRVTFHP